MALKKITLPTAVTSIVQVPPVDNKSTFIRTRLTFINWLRKFNGALGGFFKDLSPISHAISNLNLFEAEKFKGAYKEDSSWNVGDFVIDARGHLFVYADPSSTDAKWHLIDLSKNTLGGFGRKWKVVASLDAGTTSNRVSNAIYSNDSDAPMMVNVVFKQNSTNDIVANGQVEYARTSTTTSFRTIANINNRYISGSFVTLSFIIPPKKRYRVWMRSGVSYYYWMELT